MSKCQEISMIRISKQARDKLTALAKEKQCTQSVILSKIVCHYYNHKIALEAPSEDALKMIFSELKNSRNFYFEPFAVTLAKIESLMMALMQEDRQTIDEKIDDENQTFNPDLSVRRPQIAEPTTHEFQVILRTLLDPARRQSIRKVGSDTNVVMIKIPEVEFLRMEEKFNRLCISQNL